LRVSRLRLIDPLFCLLDALDGAVGAVEESRWLSVLFSPESLTMTVSVADWLVRVAQMLLMEHLTTRPDETRPDRRALLRDFVIPGILNPTQGR
jgi:hypothetical protein